MSFLTRIKDAWAVLNGYHLQEWSPDRQFWVNPSQDARRDIPYSVRRSMLSWAREMERKDPIFQGFLRLCEQYVIGPTGLRIVSGSANTEWAQLANAEWDGWQPWCDVSSRFSFGQRQGLIEREVEVAGECFIYLTYGSSNRPRIQLIESESVETPGDLTGDPTVFDGIKYDPNGRPVAYYVKGADGKFRDPIPSEQMVHLFDPSRINQGRGLSIIYPVIDGMIDLRESIGFEMASQKDGAETSKIIYNETGEVKTASGMRRQMVTGATQTTAGASATTSDAEYYKKAMGARTWVLKRGDKVEQFKHDRPAEAVQKFWDLVSARIGCGLGVPIEVIIMKSLQGTATRGAYDIASAFFRARAAERAESFAQVWAHVIANAPNLRRNMPGDWRKTRYTPPRSINVDVGRNSNAIIQEFQTGFRSLEDICGEMGKDWQDVLGQRARELKRAKELEAEYDLEPGSIIGLDVMQQDQPQAVPITQE